MRRSYLIIGSIICATAMVASVGTPAPAQENRLDDLGVLRACIALGLQSLDEEKPLRPIATQRSERFQGKVAETNRLMCRGGSSAVQQRPTPWVEWSNYFGTASKRSMLDVRDQRGITGALIDLEYQRMELIKFNLFDNKTFAQYAGSPTGPVLKKWSEMRLEPTHPSFARVGGNGPQRCDGDLIRHRTLTGICNDIENPAMGASGQLFARNVEFESTFPDIGANELAKNRHGDRLGLLKPDPQLISRKLFTRDQAGARNCNQGHGASDSVDADCPYRKAPSFNVLAAFWIQFMTHDWFSHLDEVAERPVAHHDEPRLRDAGGGPTRLPPQRQDGRGTDRQTPPPPQCSRPRRLGPNDPRGPTRRRATPSRPGGTRRRSMATTSARSGASSVMRLIARSSTCGQSHR